MISRVYYVEGLGHNLFSVGQFCDSDLEVAFNKHTCYIRDLEGVDLLKGSSCSNLCTLSLEDMMLSSPICLLSKASKIKSWLWHRRLSHLNFNYITTLAKQGLVHGLPRLKFQKNHLCFACALEAVATACLTQNRSLIQKHHYKTPYELIHNKKPDLYYFHVFDVLCYPTNDSKDLGKLKPKADIGIFVAMDSKQFSSRLEPQLLTPGIISPGLVPNPHSPTPYVPPTKKDWDIFFQLMFGEYFSPPPSVASLVLAVVTPVHANSTGSPSSTLVDQDEPSPSTSQTPQESQSQLLL
ncbi:integrase, catalytic region, zinc finger, CCHC-type containing protein [Tanacetum coccineum]